MKNSLLLEDDKMCFVCGKKNTSGLRLKFILNADSSLKTEFTPRKIHQGFKDLVHGGIIALILDETMLNLVWRLGKSAVTGNMDVRFKKPCKVGKKLYFFGKIKNEEDKIIYTEALAKDKTGNIMAIANAKCFKLN